MDNQPRGLTDELSLLEKIRVPQWIGLDASGGTLELHGFADASERAFAAVLYLRAIIQGETRISLLMAKTKV